MLTKVQVAVPRTVQCVMTWAREPGCKEGAPLSARVTEMRDREVGFVCTCKRARVKGWTG